MTAKKTPGEEFDAVLRGLSSLAENYDQRVPEGEPEQQLTDAAWDVILRSHERSGVSVADLFGWDEPEDEASDDEP